RATVDQGPGASGTPTDSSFFWDQVPSCPGGYPQTTGGPGLEGVLTPALFDLMFPARDPFYTYQGLLDATRVAGLTAFANTGTVALRRRELAAALANFSHETGGLFFVREQARPVLCDLPSSAQWPCAPGQSYFGRGPIQLSWNFNYGPAGVFLGQPLLTQPELVATNPSIAWQSALWYWVTQSGPGDRPAHNCVVDNQGFGCTIRSINGALECNGGNPAQVQSRIDAFQSFLLILNATAVGPDGC
ncbi:MAG TPA: chitinase, partial [Vicinamibacteria bacterium]